HTTPAQNARHTLERQADQLRGAGILDVPPPDLSWVPADLERLGLPERFVALVPGGAPHRPEKRWPVEHYAALAQIIVSRGAAPVVVGGPTERRLGAAIRAACRATRDLTGETDLAAVVALGRRA